MRLCVCVYACIIYAYELLPTAESSLSGDEINVKPRVKQQQVISTSGTAEVNSVITNTQDITHSCRASAV